MLLFVILVSIAGILECSCLIVVMAAVVVVAVAVVVAVVVAHVLGVGFPLFFLSRLAVVI